MSYNIGQIFREMRKSRGYTLKEVSENIVSTSCLSKFEKGETDISLSSFLAITNKLNIDFEEIVYQAREAKNDFNTFLNVVSDLYVHRKYEELAAVKEEQLNLFEETKDPYYRLNSLIILSFLYDIDPDTVVLPEDKEYISSTLFNIQLWSNYEIYLFGNTLNLLTFHTITLICNEVNKVGKSQPISPGLRKNIINLFINVIIIFINGKDYERSKQLISYIEKYLGPYYFFEKSRVLFLEGVIEYKLGNEAGMNLIQSSLQIMKVLETTVYKNHEGFLESLDIPVPSV